MKKQRNKSQSKNKKTKQDKTLENYLSETEMSNLSNKEFKVMPTKLRKVDEHS